MRGVAAAAEEVLGLQTRIGLAHPEQVSGDERWFSPVYATANRLHVRTRLLNDSLEIEGDDRDVERAAGILTQDLVAASSCNEPRFGLPK